MAEISKLRSGQTDYTIKDARARDDISKLGKLAYKDSVAYSELTGKPSGAGTTATLTVSAWNGTSAPYIYDLGTAYASGNYAVMFDSTKGTNTQLCTAQAACILGGEGSKLYAYGKKPDLDIPIKIVQL